MNYDYLSEIDGYAKHLSCNRVGCSAAGTDWNGHEVLVINLIEWITFSAADVPALLACHAQR